jgi:hypothetical protein
MAVKADRMQSFKDWPIALRQQAPTLSDAGFFYTGVGDQVCCFSCGGGVKNWEENDDPWEEHARWHGDCEHVNLVKGADFITKLAETPREAASKVSPPSETAEVEIEDFRLCRVCYNDERNTTFVPCGHLVACAMCASSVTSCPICKSVTKPMRIYFS